MKFPLYRWGFTTIRFLPIVCRHMRNWFHIRLSFLFVPFHLHLHLMHLQTKIKGIILLGTVCFSCNYNLYQKQNKMCGYPTNQQQFQVSYMLPLPSQFLSAALAWKLPQSL